MIGVRRSAGGYLLATCVAASSVALAEPGDDSSQAPEVSARTETHFRLYQRALLPGPYGAVVTEETAAPIVEYVSVTARDLDAPWQKRGLDVELDAWGSATFGEAGAGRRFDGEVQHASVRQRIGPAWFRLGRQHVAGGAARYARFDGVAVGGQLPIGFGMEGYGGFTVLPRWAARPGYHQLGSAAESLWRDPAALPEPDRAEHWVVGGRAFYDSRSFDFGASIHEARESGGLAHRSLATDSRFQASQKLSLGGAAVMELDARRVADARLWGNFAPLSALELELEVLHAEPALFLSRQSVLSAFSTEAYGEVGGSARWKVWRELTLTGSGFVQIHDSEDVGQRSEIGARIAPGRGDGTLVMLSMSRVSALDNGYVSMRNAWRQRIDSRFRTTIEAYHYRYDEPIAGYETSSVYAGTSEWVFTRRVSALWGASFAHTPYAAADAQTQLRLRYASGGLE